LVSGENKPADLPAFCGVVVSVFSTACAAAAPLRVVGGATGKSLPAVATLSLFSLGFSCASGHLLPPSIVCVG
jgi:hypothetical protein